MHDLNPKAEICAICPKLRVNPESKDVASEGSTSGAVVGVVSRWRARTARVFGFLKTSSRPLGAAAVGSVRHRTSLLDNQSVTSVSNEETGTLQQTAAWRRGAALFVSANIILLQRRADRFHKKFEEISIEAQKLAGDFTRTQHSPRSSERARLAYDLAGAHTNRQMRYNSYP